MPKPKSGSVDREKPASSFIKPLSAVDKPKKIFSLKEAKAKLMSEKYLPGRFLRKKDLADYKDNLGVLDDPLLHPPILDDEMQTVAREYGAKLNWKVDRGLVDIQRLLLEIYSPLLGLFDVAERATKADTILSASSVMNYSEYALAYAAATVQRLNYQRRKNVMTAIESSIAQKTSGRPNSGGTLLSRTVSDNIERDAVSSSSTVCLQSGQSAPLLFGTAFVQTLSTKSENLSKIRKGVTDLVTNSFGAGVASKAKRDAANTGRGGSSRFHPYQKGNPQRSPSYRGRSHSRFQNSDYSRSDYRGSFNGRSYDNRGRQQNFTPFPSRGWDFRKESKEFNKYDNESSFILSNPSESSAVGGRLRFFAENWSQITQDPWILETIRGYKIPFLTVPHQPAPPRVLQFSEREQQAISSEIEQMLEKQAIRRLDNPSLSEGFYSQLFSRPKKDGGIRPILNVHPLNAFVPYEHFKMEGLHMLPGLIQKGDFMAKLDLKDAYFTIPMAEESKKFLRFQWGNEFYEFQC